MDATQWPVASIPVLSNSPTVAVEAWNPPPATPSLPDATVAVIEV